jgi:hypothetical protein
MGAISGAGVALRNKLMKRYIPGIAALIFLSFMPAGAFPGQTVYVLELQDIRQERNLLRLRIPSQEFIHLRTIHSLALTPYTHIYKFDEEGNLILEGAIFESGGGGFPEKGDGVWSMVDGKFHVDQMNRFVGTLRFRVSPVSQETLILSRREYPLYRMVPEGTLVELKVYRERSRF